VELHGERDAKLTQIFGDCDRSLSAMSAGGQ